MPWLWDNFQQYREWVHPVDLDRPSLVWTTHQETWFTCHSNMHEAARTLSSACQSLLKLGFGNDNFPTDRALLDQARELTWVIVREGEELLLYHKRLAQSEWAYDFFHEHDLDEHWVRYAATDRIFREISNLVDAAGKLLRGYHKLQEEDENFLIKNLDLSNSLEADFLLSRNLFSVGFDELGVFAAGRGLENVLREIAKRRKIMLSNIKKPACEADLHLLIETFGELRFTNGKPVLEKETLALLHYGRTVRNTTAHPGGRSRRNPRQLAQLMTDQAQEIWNTCKQTRFRKPRVIQKVK